jgi:DNA repair exonuclease SbcCD nuclease subunit
MKKVLYVGDPHCRVEDIKDCNVLVSQIIEVAKERKVDSITFLGDMHHNHAVVQVDVLGFWRHSLSSIREATGLPIVLLVGNHDEPGDSSSTAHALLAYVDMPGVVVIDQSKIIDRILHLPFYHTSDEFVSVCDKNPAAITVVCHQEFNGAQFEGGFYAKNGVQPESIPQTQVISGHIHLSQEFGKVWYVGAPRWMQASDANTEKFLTVVEHDDDGSILNRALVPSQCRQLIQITDTPENPYDLNGDRDPRHKYLVTIEGPASWIAERLPSFSGWAKVRSSRTDHTQVRVRESEGLGKALARYLKAYKPNRGTPPEVLEGLINARISL